MSLEEIKSKIIQEANEKALIIKKKDEEKAAEIIKSAEEKSNKMREESLKRAYIETENIKRKIIGNANSNARKEILSVKQKLIENVIDTAIKRISELSDDEYLKFITNRFLTIGKELTGKCLLEICEKDKNRITQNLTKTIEKELQKYNPNIEINLTNNFRNDITGGFIIKTGDFEINNSVESIIKSKYSQLETEIAKIIFPE